MIARPPMPPPPPLAQPPAPAQPTPDPSNAAALAIATPPAPSAPTGLTQSAPLNVGLGTTTAGVVNYGTASASNDPMLSLFGLGLAFFFNWFKQWPRFDQQKHAHIALLIFGVLIGIVVIGIIGHEAFDKAIAKGCGIAANAWADYTGIKIGGLPGMPAAAETGPPMAATPKG